MTERKEKKPAPAVPTRTPGKRESGIFANLRKPAQIHPVEEILQLPPAAGESPVPPATVVQQTTVPAEHGSAGDTTGAQTVVSGTTVSPETTVVPERTVVSDTAEPLSETMVTLRTTVVPETTVAGQITVQERQGYLRVPNTIIDGLLPLLGPYAQLVYLRLFRLTHGFDRPSCLISFETLALSTHLSKSSVIRAIEELESKSLVTREPQLHGSRRERGNVYEVHMPTVSPQTTVRRGITVRPQETVVRGTHMKENMKESIETGRNENPVYEIRTIAARLFEAHRGEAGFDRERLRRLVREALIGQGREPAEVTIEEAIRGMAV